MTLGSPPKRKEELTAICASIIACGMLSDKKNMDGVPSDKARELVVMGSIEVALAIIEEVGI